MSQDHTLEEERVTGRIDLALLRKVLSFSRPYAGLLIALGSMGALVAVFDSVSAGDASLIDGFAAARATGAGANIGAHLAVYAGLVVAFAVCILGFIIVADGSRWA